MKVEDECGSMKLVRRWGKFTGWLCKHCGTKALICDQGDSFVVFTEPQSQNVVVSGYEK